MDFFSSLFLFEDSLGMDLLLLCAVWRDNSLDVVETIEGVHGCEIVYVESENFVAYLLKHRIVELIKRQLYSFPTLLQFLCRWASICANLRVVGL